MGHSEEHRQSKDAAPPEPRRSRRAIWGWLASLLWLATIAVWALAVLGRPLSPWAGRTVVAATFLATGLFLVVLCLSLWRHGRGRLSAGRLAILLTAVSLLVHLTGIQFELLDHPRSDEGIYYEEAVKINSGEPLPATFNYGHLYYYAPALVLWMQELFAAPIAAAVEAVYGLTSELAVRLLLLRALSGLLGALTTLPVFWAGYRIGGRFAAATGAVLITFSTLYNTVAHEVISDVPSGFFAAVCFALTARLLDGENWRDYLLAGIAAGLAAASKYPGGVAALAILGMWVYWRLRLRSWSWHLLGAAGASLTAMLAVMPALWLRTAGVATGEGKDLFFGWRQYARSGWTGVMPDSVPGYYARLLLGDLGLPAILLGVTGLFLLRSRERQRLAVMLPFALGYCALIGAMSMAVIRNLQPVLPALTVILGVGIAGWQGLVGRRLPVSRTFATVALALVAIAGPVARTFAWDLSHSRLSTRQQMRDWIEANVPHGAGIVREDYTPDLEPRHYLRLHNRFLWRVPEELLAEREWDYVMVADAAYARFFPENRASDDHRALVAERYEEIFAWDRAADFPPSRFRAGPRVTLYRKPAAPEYRTRRRWEAGEVSWVSDKSIRPAQEGGPLVYGRRWQIAVFKDFFEAGLYEVELSTVPAEPEAYVHLVTPDNHEVGSFRAAGLVVELPRRDKYFVRVFQEPGSSLSGVVMRPAARGATPSPSLPPA